MKTHASRQAFTLIELLVSVGVIGTLSSVVITAVNPSQQLGKSADAKRNSFKNQIQKAAVQYVIDYGANPGESAIPEGAGSATDICRNGRMVNSCINIDDIIPNYFACIPYDSAESNENHTGYQIYTQNARIRVVALYASGSSAAEVTCEAPPEPVAYWKMDEATLGSTAAEQIHGFDLALSNIADPQGPNSNVPSVSFSNAFSLEYDGVDDYASTPYDSRFDLREQLTIAAWVHPTSFSAGDNVNSIVRKGEANPNMWQLMIEDGYATLQLEGGDGNNGRAQGATALSTDTWQHVVGVWDGATASVYVNGALDGQGPYAATGGLLQVDTRDIYVGGRDGTDNFHGLVDDVRVYDVALGSGHIVRLASGDPL